MTTTFESQHLNSIRGHFLIAMPGLADPNFSKTVTAICEHSSQGSMGLIINRQIPELTGRKLFEELDIDHQKSSEEIPVYFGGPVHINEIFVLHGPPFEWIGCLEVTPFLALSNTIDILKAIAEGKGPEYYLILLGCAGWGPGQLEGEVMQNSWVTCPVSEEIIYSSPVELRWKEAMNAAGVDPALLSGRAGNA